MDLKVIVTCNADGRIVNSNIFAFTEIFKNRGFIKEIMECVGIMPEYIETTWMDKCALVCHDVTSSSNTDVLISVIRDMDGKNVGKICAFADAMLFDALRKAGYANTFYCVYPENYNSFIAGDYNRETKWYHDGWNVDLCSVRPITEMSDDEIKTGIDSLDDWINTDALSQTQPVDYTQAYADFITSLVNRENGQPSDDDVELDEELIAEMADDTIKIEGDGFDGAMSVTLRDNYPTMDMFGMLSDNQSQLVDKMGKLFNVVNLHTTNFEKVSENFKLVSKDMNVLFNATQKAMNILDTNSNTISGLRTQIGNVVRENESLRRRLELHRNVFLIVSLLLISVSIIKFFI